MQLKSDKEIERWFTDEWLGEIKWDEHNEPKLKKHKVDKTAIEALFWDYPTIFLGQIVEPKDQNWQEKRYISVGITAKQKVYAVIWTIRENTLRPICCRRARKNEERVYYEKQR